MRFLIISHVVHSQEVNTFFGYGPYIREMNLWLSHVDSVEVIAPSTTDNPGKIDLAYNQNDLIFTRIPSISIKSLENMLKTIVSVPYIIYKIQRAMRQADHIHLRCPGNIGALGCLTQIFFPKTKKTAKYAGNWDPKAKQPKLYRFQKWILSNTFLTRNMTVLAYGEWPDQSSNIKPFFTATYLDEERVEMLKNFKMPYRAMFVGTLGQNKRPFKTVQIIKALRKSGVDISLDIYGAGKESSRIEQYIDLNELKDHVFLHENQPAAVVKEAYKKSHFLFLLSQSEGWPKAVAEAMFWGVIPIVTSVSCVPCMLDYGRRGILLDQWDEDTIATLSHIMNQEERLAQMSSKAQAWSHQYTLNSFERAIKQLL